MSRCQKKYPATMLVINEVITSQAGTAAGSTGRVRSKTIPQVSRARAKMSASSVIRFQTAPPRLEPSPLPCPEYIGNLSGSCRVSLVVESIAPVRLTLAERIPPEPAPRGRSR